MRLLGIVMVVALTAACERENRRFSEMPPSASAVSVARQSVLQPGPVLEDTSPVESPYDANAYAVSQGKMLFAQMNCVGCHANGGGGMGPPLMDADWIYGSQPQQIFATIMEGRPNGMPSWRGKLSNQQVWQIVAYVRSMSGLNRRDIRPGRNDAMSAKVSEQNKSPEHPKQSFEPPASQMP